MLQQQIKDKIKEAMIAKDQVKLATLRGLSAAFTNELVAKGKTPQDIISDEDAMIVITRLAKQRKDSIDQFTKGGREDLAGNEKLELDVLSEYLPEMMSHDEALKFITSKKEELGISDVSEKGKLMATLMKDLKGKPYRVTPHLKPVSLKRGPKS